MQTEVMLDTETGLETRASFILNNLTGERIYRRDSPAKFDELRVKIVKAARARACRRARHEAMESLGLNRVRGALGGVYYE